MSIRTWIRLAAAALAFFLCAAQAQEDAAKSYPARPVRIIVGNPAGGGTDLVTRILAARLSEALGQSVVVENKPGAFGIIGTEYVAKAPADGYTLMMGPIGVFVFTPITYPKLNYKRSDFVPISLVATNAAVLVVNAALPIRSVPDLLAYAKANPAKANYAATGASFQFPVEMLKSRLGLALEYIPYKSEQDLVTAVLAGDALTTLLNPAPVLGLIKNGKLRGLAVTAATRLTLFPDIPTVAEIGVPEMETQYWFGLFAPSATPQSIVKKLEREVNAVVKQPEFKNAMNGRMLEALGSTSEELARLISTDFSRWDAFSKASHIKLQDQSIAK